VAACVMPASIGCAIARGCDWLLPQAVKSPHRRIYSIVGLGSQLRSTLSAIVAGH
jgi:hypothetical protein